LRCTTTRSPLAKGQLIDALVPAFPRYIGDDAFDLVEKFHAPALHPPGAHAEYVVLEAAALEAFADDKFSVRLGGGEDPGLGSSGNMPFGARASRPSTMLPAMCAGPPLPLRTPQRSSGICAKMQPPIRVMLSRIRSMIRCLVQPV